MTPVGIAAGMDPSNIETNYCCFLCMGLLPCTPGTSSSNVDSFEQGLTSFQGIFNLLEIGCTIQGDSTLKAKLCGGCKVVIDGLSALNDRLKSIKQEVNASLLLFREKFMEGETNYPRVEAFNLDMNSPNSVEVLRKELINKCNYVLDKKAQDESAALNAAMEQLKSRRGETGEYLPGPVASSLHTVGSAEAPVPDEEDEEPQPSTSTQASNAGFSFGFQVVEMEEPNTEKGDEHPPSTSTKASSSTGFEWMKTEKASAGEGELEEGEVEDAYYPEEGEEHPPSTHTEASSTGFEWMQNEEASTGKGELEEREVTPEANVEEIIDIKFEFREINVSQPEVVVASTARTPARKNGKRKNRLSCKVTPPRRNGERKNRIRCKVCHDPFVSSAHLKLHRKRFHARNHPAKCKHCIKVFKTPRGLNIHHTRIHHKEFIIKIESGPEGVRSAPLFVECDFCDKRLKPTYYRKHRTYHCKKNTARGRENAQGHQRANALRCNVCHMSFKKVQGLKSHFKQVHKVHFQETELVDQSQNLNITPQAGPSTNNTQCDVCGKLFPKWTQFRLHMETIHLGRGFACNDCGRVFFHPSSLAKHQCMVQPNQNM